MKIFTFSIHARKNTLLSFFLTTALLVLGCPASAQQDVYSNSGVSTGNWWDASNPWFYVSSGNQDRPDNFARNYVKIGHNNNLIMTTNGAFFQLASLDFDAGASVWLPPQTYCPFNSQTT